MTSYKTIYVPTRQEYNGSIDTMNSYRIDGLGPATDVQALLFEYEEKDYGLVSMESIKGGKSGLVNTQRVFVVLHKMTR